MAKSKLSKPNKPGKLSKPNKPGKKTYQMKQPGRVDVKQICEPLKEALRLENTERFLRQTYFTCIEIFRKINEQRRLGSVMTQKDNENGIYDNINFLGQFESARSRENTDICANLMYISNSLAHRYSSAGEDELGNLFYLIKQRCMKILIEYQKQGKEVLIEKSLDEEGKTLFNFALPGYFEPFSVHTGDIEIEFDEKNNTMIYNQLGLKPLFPLFLTDENEKGIQRLLEEENIKPHLRKKYQWYKDTKEQFRQMRER